MVNGLVEEARKELFELMIVDTSGSGRASGSTSRSGSTSGSTKKPSIN
jgi:hypothetical protein